MKWVLVFIIISGNPCLSFCMREAKVYHVFFWFKEKIFFEGCWVGFKNVAPVFLLSFESCMFYYFFFWLWHHESIGDKFVEIGPVTKNYRMESVVFNFCWKKIIAKVNLRCFRLGQAGISGLSLNHNILNYKRRCCHDSDMPIAGHSVPLMLSLFSEVLGLPVLDSVNTRPQCHQCQQSQWS
jgi:hypothetical protein